MENNINDMDLIKEMISKVDVSSMYQILSQTEEDFDTDDIDISWHLDRWARNKKHLYIALGRNLKKSIETDYSPDYNEVRQKLCKICDMFTSTIPVATGVIRSLSTQEILENSLKEDIFVFNQKFQAQSKISKMLSKLSFNTEEIKKLQIELSKLIQENKVKGEAILSIDPIDYLTMSDNSSGWRSCHSIRHGDFKAGCLSYMCDSSTLIAYTASKGNVVSYGNGVSIPSKTWRQCVYMPYNLEYAIQSRQYPCVNRGNRKAISTIIKEMFGPNFKARVASTSDEDFCQSFIIDYSGNDDSLHYNDILNASFGDFIIITDFEGDLTEEWGESVQCCIIGSDVKFINYDDYISSASEIAYDRSYDW